MRSFYVYIMANPSRTLYVGVTNDLVVRVSQHKQKATPGFTQRYNITRLAYYEDHDSINAAIAREKQIKGWPRDKKIALIESMNPTWRDLAVEPEWWARSERPVRDSSQPRNDMPSLGWDEK